MRKWLRLAARVYPAEWRERYGAEFDALLDDVRPGWAAVWDVLQGGMTMQVKRSRNALSVAAFATVGALAAAAFGFVTPDRFESRGQFRLELSPKVSQPGRLEYDVPAIFYTAFSRANLAQIVERHDVYSDERRSGRLRLDDAAERMRNDIALLARRETTILRLSFSHPDPATAQRVAQDLVAQLTQSELSKVEVIDPPDLPRLPAGPNRVTMAGVGFGGGALLGLLVSLVFGRRSQPTS